MKLQRQVLLSTLVKFLTFTNVDWQLHVVWLVRKQSHFYELNLIWKSKNDAFFIEFSFKNILEIPQNLWTPYMWHPGHPIIKITNLTTVKMRLSFVHKIGYIFWWSGFNTLFLLHLYCFLVNAVEVFALCIKPSRIFYSLFCSWLCSYYSTLQILLSYQKVIKKL